MVLHCLSACVRQKNGSPWKLSAVYITRREPKQWQVFIISLYKELGKTQCKDCPLYLRRSKPWTPLNLNAVRISFFNTMAIIKWLFYWELVGLFTFQSDHFGGGLSWSRLASVVVNERILQILNFFVCMGYMLLISLNVNWFATPLEICYHKIGN